MPAYPKKIAVKAGSETVYIKLFGDEHFKHAETLDGFTIIQDKDEWYYAEKDENGFLRASSYKLSVNPSAEIRTFLENTPRHLVSDKNVQSRTRRSRATEDEQTGSGAIGERRVLVILMQYSDLDFIKSGDDFNRLFNTENYDEEGARGSVYDYYRDVSYGKLQMKCDILGPFTSQHEKAYYGANNSEGYDKNPTELFEEAMNYVNSSVNLKDYDSDDDGYVDNVHIIFAGYGEEAGASSNAIWSHEATFFTPYEFQGMRIDRYSCAPELRGNSGKGISRIGPHCHEIGHALGAMDYYDTNYGDRGNFEGTGVWDIMASGSWNADGAIPADFNPYVKMKDFKWIDVDEMPEGEVVLESSALSENSYYRLTNSFSDYYLVENRTIDKWGEALPGSGLLIFHVHPNVANVGNEINATYPQKCYPVCASSKSSIPNSQPSSYGNINTDGCPFPGSSGNTSFGTSSVPAAFSWSGEQTFIDMREIQLHSDKTISLLNLSRNSENASGILLLHDEFEFSKDYDIRVDSGVTQWYRIEVDDSKKGKNLVLPHSGSSYMRFQPNKLAVTPQQSTILFNSAKAVERAPALLSFYYLGDGYRPDQLTLEVSCQYDDEIEWDTLKIVGNGKSEWKYYSINLPEADAYKIKIVGYASYGQTIYLDDIEIIQKTASNINAQIGYDKSSVSSIYNLFGHRLHAMKKGLFIIRKEDGTIIKVIK